MKKLTKIKSKKQWDAEGLIDAKQFAPDNDRLVLVYCDRGVCATAQFAKRKWLIVEDFAKGLSVKRWTEI